MKIRGRDLAFTRWAMRRTLGRSGLNSRLFATDPWPVVRRAIRTSSASPTAREAAVAFLGQAKAYFHGATDAALAEAKPVLLYYCFLNLAKAFVLARGTVRALSNAKHGLSEKLRTGNRELVDAYLDAHPTSPTTENVFDLLWKALGGPGLGAVRQFDLVALLPQVVPGHRLWAIGANKAERFVALEGVQLLEDKHARSVWVALRLQAGDLTRLGVARKQVLRDSALAGAWRDVTAPVGQVCFEPISPTPYGGFATDKVMDAIDAVAPHLWTAVLGNPPYRKYYLYLCPPGEVASRMPQLCSIYAIAYYLGSITRYRPHHFTSIIDGPFGPFIEAFLNDQPTQFLYLIASEFAEREVTRAALA